jgi:hypothetical protein
MWTRFRFCNLFVSRRLAAWREAVLAGRAGWPSGPSDEEARFDAHQVLRHSIEAAPVKDVRWADPKAGDRSDTFRKWLGVRPPRLWIVDHTLDRQTGASEV